MLQATQDFIKWFRQRDRSSTIYGSYIEMISRKGTVEDAKALVEFYLEDPECFYRTELLPLISLLGTTEEAEHIYQALFDQTGNYKGNELPVGVLSCLGSLRYEPIIPVLMKGITSDDWYTTTDSCMGMLHFSCEEYLEEIETEIRKDQGKSLFREMLPILCYKTGNDEWIPQLYEWGKKASVDCNGGIVLGIALFGDPAREVFKKVLWDPSWEINDVGTGTLGFGLMGKEVLGITLRELYQEILDVIEVLEEEELYERCALFLRLAIRKIEMIFPTYSFYQLIDEDYVQLNELLFPWDQAKKSHSIERMIQDSIRDQYYRDVLQKYLNELELVLQTRIEKDLMFTYM